MTALLLPPPLAAIVAALLVSGIVLASGAFLRALRIHPAEGNPDDTDPVARAAAIATVAGLLGGVIHALALMQLAPVALLRLIAVLLVAAGLVQVRRWLAAGWLRRRLLPVWWVSAPWSARSRLILESVLVVALALVALAPATDADSLDYHLGWPLDWLQHGGIYARPDWLHARLAGLGEALNLLGLAAGTDALGACLQFTGAMLAAGVIASMARGYGDTIQARLFVLASPVMLFLVPTQKFYLLPAAGMLAAVSLAARESVAMNAGRILLIFGAVGAAAGSKYTFLLSGAIVSGLTVWTVVRKGRPAGALGRGLAGALTGGAALAALVAAPVYLRNWWLYGDPVSPFLARWSPEPDSAVVDFAIRLRYAPADLPAWLLRLPSLFVTLNPADVSTVLGVGVLCVLAVRPATREARILAWSAALLAAACLTLSQVSGRFLLESYLWAGAAVAASASGQVPGRAIRAVNCLIVVQALVVTIAAVVLAALLSPGIVTSASRQRVMARHAFGAAEAAWIDALEPTGTPVLLFTRAHALLHRPFVQGEVLVTANVDGIRDFLREHPVGVAAVHLPAPPALARFLEMCGRLSAGPQAIQTEVRNPLGSGQAIEVAAYVVDLTQMECQAADDGL